MREKVSHHNTCPLALGLAVMSPVDHKEQHQGALKGEGVFATRGAAAPCPLWNSLLTLSPLSLVWKEQLVVMPAQPLCYHCLHMFCFSPCAKRQLLRLSPVLPRQGWKATVETPWLGRGLQVLVGVGTGLGRLVVWNMQQLPHWVRG